MAITKPQLAKLIAQRRGASQKLGAQAPDDVLEAIAAEIASGGEVKLVGFGSFVRRRQRGGKGRNLRTGEEVIFPETQRPIFAPSKPLKDRVRAAAGGNA